MLSEEELSILEEMESPEVQKLVGFYKEFIINTESPTVNFYKSVGKLVDKLASDIAVVAQTEENLFETERSDDTFNRLQKLLAIAGKMLSDLDGAKKMIFSVSVKTEEGESSGGITWG